MSAPAGSPTLTGLAVADPPERWRALGFAVDHLVVLTPDFERTSAALELAGLPLRRIRQVEGGRRQGFRRLGPAILELVQAPGRASEGPARFWGLAFAVTDLDVLALRLGDHLSPVRPAVQLGRRIATLRATAELTPAVAFMDPDPPR